MSAFRFTVPGVPVGKQRARSTRSGHHYTPKATAEWERWAAARAVLAMTAQGWIRLLEGPVEVVVHAVKDRPGRLPDGPRVLAPVKPDADNVAKAVLDALNATKRAWRDDAQVCHLDAWTWYAATGEPPTVDVTVRGLAP